MSRPNSNFHANYLKTALDNEYGFVANAKFGTRADTLNSGIQAGTAIDARRDLRVSGARSLRPLDEAGISAVYSTIRSGMAAGGRNRRFPDSDHQHGRNLARSVDERCRCRRVVARLLGRSGCGTQLALGGSVCTRFGSCMASRQSRRCGGDRYR
jgi:hypothetical protein